jgi:hypothetical protein
VVDPNLWRLEIDATISFPPTMTAVEVPAIDSGKTAESYVQIGHGVKL